MVKCKKCNKDFTREGNANPYYRYCGECFTKVYEEICQKRYDKYKESSFKTRLAKYNLSKQSLDLMFQLQNNKCAICERSICIEETSNFHIDHCHISGKVRGLLCPRCNYTLGAFKDNILHFQNAVNYLVRHKP